MTTINIPIIYQDHQLLIVNKPAGLVIHPTYKNADGTMWDALLDYVKQQGPEDWQPPVLSDEPEWAGAPLHIQSMLRQRRTEKQWKEDGLLPRPCLLHRLDKDTSGVVALARTEHARRHLVRQFHDHSIVKRYLAVVQKGAPVWTQPRTTFTVTRPQETVNIFQNSGAIIFAQNDELVLDGSLQRDPDDRRRSIVGPAGQSATTLLKVLASAEPFTLLEVRPITGRTHQIRAHLAAMGYAIVGDTVYAPSSMPGTMSRQFLHAHSLELRRYPDNALSRFVAPLAEDLVFWMKNYFPTALGAIDAYSAIPT